jgi:hypothetical protein
MSRPIVSLVALLALVACSEGPNIDHAEAAVLKELRDPDSAKFTEVHQCGDNGKLVFGSVTARNVYGGFTGPIEFYYNDHDGVGRVDFVVDQGTSTIVNDYWIPAFLAPGEQSITAQLAQMCGAGWPSLRKR